MCERAAIGHVDNGGNAPSRVEGDGCAAIGDHKLEGEGGVGRGVDVVLGLLVDHNVGVVLCAVDGDDAVALSRGLCVELYGYTVRALPESVDTGGVSADLGLSIGRDEHDRLDTYIKSACSYLVGIVGYVLGEPGERNGAKQNDTDQNAGYGNEKALRKCLFSYFFLFCLKKVFQESTSSQVNSC